ncbi:MAG TPA: MarR family transcriptional regulator [Cellulomonas sp.]
MTSSPAATALEPMLCFAVYSAEHRIGRIYRDLLAPWSLSYTQYLVLVALWHEDRLTVGSLGELLGLDSGTLSPLLKRLESRGLLARRRSADDERIVGIGLTEDGRRLRAELADIPRCLGERLGIGREEAAELVARVRTLTDRTPIA